MLETAGQEKMIPPEILSGNLVVETKFLDDNQLISISRVKIYYVWGYLQIKLKYLLFWEYFKPFTTGQILSWKGSVCGKDSNLKNFKHFIYLMKNTY